LFGKLKTLIPKSKGKAASEGDQESELELANDQEAAVLESPASETNKPKAAAQGKPAAQGKSSPLVKAKPVDEALSGSGVSLGSGVSSGSGLRKAQPIQDEDALQLFNAAGQELSKIDSHGENKFANKNAMNLAVQIVDYALQMRASDILIDPKSPAVYAIRFRIDGSLRTVKELPVETCRSIINSLKVVSGMNLSEHRQPQTGFFAAKKGDVAESFRVAGVGILNGEKLSLRMLNRNLGSSTLDEINVPKIQQNAILKVLEKNTGMIVVCGPMDSGRTTTLYSMVNHLDRATNHVISIEDPIEAPLENADQHTVDFRKKGKMAALLRDAVIPKDPEVILVGDIPDAESASLLLETAQTGHLVLACLQANSNAEALSRLLDLGTPPDLLAAGLDLLISQRLLRRLCDSCKKPAQLSPSLLQGFQSKSIDTSKISEPGKCKRCGETGYFGRFAVYDMLTMTDSLRQEIVNNSNISNVLLTEGQKKGCLGLKSEAIRNVVAGVTSLEELKRVVG
jgi:type II secretory ATPase GspE/PulE/Tfp pilus assembly ATPase PilB-like protein